MHAITRARPCALLAMAGLLAAALPAAAAKSDSDKDVDVFFEPYVPVPDKKPPDLFGYFERLKDSQAFSDGYIYEPSELASPVAKAIDSPELVDVRALILKQEYLQAYKFVAARLVRQAADPALISLGRRLEFVKTTYPSFSPAQGQWSKEMAMGLTDFLYGRDAHAVLRVSYALSLNPVDQRIKAFLYRLGKFTGIPGRRIPTGTGLSLLEVKLNESEAAFKAGRFKEVERLARDVLVLRPLHPTALARLGSAMYLRKRYTQAAAVWQQAMDNEERPKEKKTLARMIARAKRKLLPRKRRKPRRKKPRRARKPKPKKPAPPDPEVLDALYDEGYTAYLKGDLKTAEEKFKKLKALAPSDKRAVKGLRRIENDRSNQRLSPASRGEQDRSRK